MMCLNIYFIFRRGYDIYMQIKLILGMGIFILIALGILSGAHYFIYRSIVDFFNISGSKVKTGLGLALFFLAASFILSSIAAHRVENLFTRSYYFSASLWTGVLTNLVVFFALAWLVIGAARIFSIDIDRAAVGVAAIILAAALSAYGVWNAFNHHVKDVTVRIKDLPAEWQGKRVVQISDLHLGHVFKERFLEKVVEEVNRLEPEMVFITGDLFDGMDGDLHLTVKPISELRAPRGSYFITGNHETYFGVEKVFDILKDVKVEILDDRLVEVDGLQVVGVSYPERGDSKDIIKTIEAAGLDRTKPSILLFHNPANAGAAQRAGVSLQLSGHTHKGQIFPFNFITKAIYRGKDYGLIEEGDFSLYTTNGVGSWGPTMRTSKKPEIVSIRLERK